MIPRPTFEHEKQNRGVQIDNLHGLPWTPCRICEAPVPGAYSRHQPMCARCWELEHRIRGDRSLARWMLQELDAGRDL